MWFDDIKLSTEYNYVSSRIRLARNIQDVLFPGKLDGIASRSLVERILKETEGLPLPDEMSFSRILLEELSDVERRSMQENRILNSTLVKKKTSTGLILSKEGSISIVVNGDDHIRLQLLSDGLHLHSLWKQAGAIDDSMNERFDYAFHEKYGYLTTYPTNIGTGLRANIVLHLPVSSQSKGFAKLISGVGRFGVTIKGVYGEGRENFGSLYDISNPKTLGQTEKEILDTVIRVANQLNANETQLRRSVLKNDRIKKQDEVYKSYGVLRYARKLALTDALEFISHVMMGVSDGLISLKNQDSLFGLMIAIQPSNILKNSDRPLSKDEIEVARADLIRSRLPDIL